jgi:hypothetical protein
MRPQIWHIRDLRRCPLGPFPLLGWRQIQRFNQYLQMQRPKPPSAATAGLRAQRQPAGNATKCVTREGTAVRLLAEWEIALLCGLLMRVRVRAHIIIARRVCRLMRGVVLVGSMRMYLFHFFSFCGR